MKQRYLYNLRCPEQHEVQIDIPHPIDADDPHSCKACYGLTPNITVCIPCGKPYVVRNLKLLECQDIDLVYFMMISDRLIKDALANGLLERVLELCGTTDLVKTHISKRLSVAYNAKTCTHKSK